MSRLKQVITSRAFTVRSASEVHHAQVCLHETADLSDFSNTTVGSKSRMLKSVLFLTPS